MCVPARTALQELPERFSLLVFKSAGKKEKRTRSLFHAAIRLVSSCRPFRATLHRELLLLSVLRRAVCGANCCPHALSSIVRRNIRTGTGLCARAHVVITVPPGRRGKVIMGSASLSLYLAISVADCKDAAAMVSSLSHSLVLPAAY